MHAIVDQGFVRGRGHPRDNEPLIKALSVLAERHPSAGFRKRYARLRRAGHPWNHKRVWRVYCALKLNLRRRRKRLRALRPPQPLVQPIRPNLQWSADFMSDALSSGMSDRIFNLMTLMPEKDPRGCWVAHRSTVIAPS
ncbi:IS3 family transposase [Marichromatium sp. AB31]|uniref:IS3 family transposase n=1 Tax=Marichromatium sp. AB31 TaxID=2483362 RepID=UPI001CC1DBCD|nr:IS3 family transposase [Marichromatium sp. AB31]